MTVVQLRRASCATIALSSFGSVPSEGHPISCSTCKTHRSMSGAEENRFWNILSWTSPTAVLGEADRDNLLNVAVYESVSTAARTRVSQVASATSTDFSSNFTELAIAGENREERRSLRLWLLAHCVKHPSRLDYCLAEEASVPVGMRGLDCRHSPAKCVQINSRKEPYWSTDVCHLRSCSVIIVHAAHGA